MLVMSQTFHQWMLIGVFRLNRGYITRNSCENRYRPQLHCNGNCVLMKKLKQQERSENNTPGTLKIETTTILLSSRSFFAQGQFSWPDGVPIRFTQSDTGKPVDRSFPVFHPPAI